MAVVRNRELKSAVIALAGYDVVCVAFLPFRSIDRSDRVAMLIEHERLPNRLAVDGNIRDPCCSNAGYVRQLNEISYDCAGVFVDHRRVEGVWAVNQNQLFGIQTIIFANRRDHVLIRIASRGRGGMNSSPPTDSKKIICLRNQWLNKADH